MIRKRLPVELTDNIINCVHDDVPTLLSCSQVSRDWVPASRLHAFHLLECTFPTRPPSLKNSVRLSILIESDLCTFRSSVTKIKLSGGPLYCRRDEIQQGEHMRRLVHSFRHLKHVSDVWVTGLLPWPFSRIRQDTLERAFAKVSKLRMTGVAGLNEKQFRRFICSFGALDTLTCAGCFFRAHFKQRSRMPPRTKPIRLIELDVTRKLVAGLQPFLTTCTELSIDDKRSHLDIGAAREALVVAGSHVSNVTVIARYNGGA